MGKGMREGWREGVEGGREWREGSKEEDELQSLTQY